MTRIHVAADSRGIELARDLTSRAESAGFEVVWHDEPQNEDGDDYPIYAVRVGRAVVEDQDAGIDAFALLVVDESLAGVVAANKVNGARAITATSPKTAMLGRRIVDANVLVLEGIAYPDTAWLVLYAFVTTGMEETVERGRQILQITEYENAGTIEGWAVQLEPEQTHVSYD